MIRAADVVRFHEHSANLQKDRVSNDTTPIWQTIAHNHQCNTLLWAAEDEARRNLPAPEIVACKRAIDAHNQQRNDATERIDELLLAELVPLPTARLNSETPGAMIDRLSILSLKIRAMRAQLERTDVDADHLASCRTRLAVLIEQRSDLAACLDTLLSDARAGRARFKVYRQMKMYNDPRYQAAA
jgi:hypothetical protein